MADGEDQGWLDDETDPFADSTITEQPADAPESKQTDETEESPVEESTESPPADEVELSMMKRLNHR